MIVAWTGYSCITGIYLILSNLSLVQLQCYFSTQPPPLPVVELAALSSFCSVFHQQASLLHKAVVIAGSSLYQSHPVTYQNGLFCIHLFPMTTTFNHSSTSCPTLHHHCGLPKQHTRWSNYLCSLCSLLASCCHALLNFSFSFPWSFLDQHSPFPNSLRQLLSLVVTCAVASSTIHS